MQHENIIGYPDDYVQNPEKHPMDYLSVILTEKDCAQKIIGVEKTIIRFCILSGIFAEKFSTGKYC